MHSSSQITELPSFLLLMKKKTTNSRMLKMVLEGNSFNLVAMGGIIYEIKNVILFSFAVFSYRPRASNRVAHALAALGCKRSLHASRHVDLESLVAGNL